MLINTYANVSTPSVQSIIPTTEWLEKIKFGEYADVITQLRKFKKGDSFYDETKKTLPCCTYNFLFDSYKKNSNIVSPTGLIYFDVDEPSFDVSTLNLDKVYSYYKSVGGKGYSILTKVENLTLDNYNATYDAILNDLNLNNYFDKDARKATQYNIISNDSDIFINNSSFIYESKNENVPISMVYKENTNIYERDGYKTNYIRYSDLTNIELDTPFVVDWNNFREVKVSIPFHKISDGRKRTLLAICCNYVWLNDWLPFDNVVKTMCVINTLTCSEPLPYSIILGIVKSIFQQKRENRLKPNYNERSIIFSKDCGYDKDEKLAICRDLYSQKRVGESKDKLYDFIESWNFQLHGKITVRKLAEVSEMNLKTVTKYYPEFKTGIAQLNAGYKK
ncbi:hypothetical protein [Pedobacter sp. CFBP9032]|uniref:hypothetical protein n=1 Tax=Pedobacter sp. CFBP9032 TaxID=3096539 RepID=UPI002A6A517D|nr:hypothetical protein [Pedobacter sp. CFBP9032]MDY0906599.1 hypothetical protein [Pedobacter sp. CFBP9032]